MAGGQRRDQQLLRITARGSASKMPVGRTGTIGLASAAQQVSAAISGIGGCSAALIAGPGQPDAVAMLHRTDPNLTSPHPQPGLHSRFSTTPPISPTTHTPTPTLPQT